MVVYTQHEATIRTKADSATNARSMLWPHRRREPAPKRAALLLIDARRAAAVSSGAKRSARLRNRDGATIAAHKQPERTAAAAASVSRSKTWQTRAPQPGRGVHSVYIFSSGARRRGEKYEQPSCMRLESLYHLFGHHSVDALCFSSKFAARKIGGRAASIDGVCVCSSMGLLNVITRAHSQKRPANAFSFEASERSMCIVTCMQIGHIRCELLGSRSTGRAHALRSVGKCPLNKKSHSRIETATCHRSDIPESRNVKYCH